MGRKIKKYKNIIERFLGGESGQRFFNFAYSIGAAIVIWGALFKILHLPGGNTLLCIGMGTEVLMFILTAFDRPGRDYHWEEVFPVFNTHDSDDAPDFSQIEITGASKAGGYVAQGGEATAVAPAPTGQVTASGNHAADIDAIAGELSNLRANVEALNRLSTVLLESYSAITENSENITASSKGYVQQMEALNRNVSGLNTIYEIQLRSVSSQLDSIDRVNHGIKEICNMYETTVAKSQAFSEQSEKMAENMRKLNEVYEKMLTAMTVNSRMQG